MENTPKVHITYKFDAFLMHLVQDVTKRSSADILNFFHELGKQVCIIGLQRKEHGGIDKRINDYFPGTAIPFHMRARGERCHYDRKIWCAVEVGFPEKLSPMSEKVLDDIATQLMENSLGFGAEITIAPFERPPIKTPKVLKDVIDAFAGRPPDEKKRRRKSTT